MHVWMYECVYGMYGVCDMFVCRGMQCIVLECTVVERTATHVCYVMLCYVKDMSYYVCNVCHIMYVCNVMYVHMYATHVCMYVCM